MPPQNPPESVFAFSFDPSLEPWNRSPSRWMAEHDKHWDGLAVATIVFDKQGRVLLVQRAAHDSMPNRWEIPGGGAEEEDDSNETGNHSRNTVLGSAARELWEEAGLIAQHFSRLVPHPAAISSTANTHGGSVFTNRTGVRFFCRFAFLAEVHDCSSVVLDPNEHQDYAWASEDEVRRQCLADGREIPLTTPSVHAVILEAFRLSQRGTTR